MQNIGMIVLGSSKTIKKSTHAQMFHGILQVFESKNAIGEFIDLKCQNHGEITRMKEPSDLNNLDGGCNRPCGQRMQCGHSCHKMCHPDQNQHLQAECREPCQKLIPACGHPCQNLCFQTHGGCNVVQQVKLPCNHTIDVPCQKATENIKCTQKVKVKMPLCEHIAELPCWKANEIQKWKKIK